MGLVMVDARTARYSACTDAESLVTLHQEMLTPHGFRCFIYATNPIDAEFGRTAQAITAGYTVSLPRRHHAANAEFGLIGAEHMTQGALIDIWGEYGANIFAYCHLFHLCATALPVSPHLRILTERQRKALELVIKGRTMREIAFAMELNATMVEKHLRGARDALQADTTAQAAAKALVLN